MMLCDSDQAHSALTGNEEVPFRPPSDMAREEHIYDLSITQEVLTGAYALQDFDFEKPSVDLAAQSKIERKHENAKYEYYDYPGEYLEEKGGKDYAKARIEELQWQYEKVAGAGTVRRVPSGRALQADRVSPRRPEPRIPRGLREPRPELGRVRIRRGIRRRTDLHVRVHGHRQQDAFPDAPHDGEARHTGSADRDRRRPRRR